MPNNNKNKASKSVNNVNNSSKVSQQGKAKGRKDGQNRMVTSSAPLAINVKSKGMAPNVMSGKGGTVVTHTEVLSAAVPALSAFGLTHTVAVQPGISTVSRGLPMGSWLPQIATQYDHYEFLKLKIRYIPTCATTRDGLVMLSFEPNPEDNPPTDFVTFKNAMRNVSGPVREPVSLDVTDLVKKKLLVRSVNVSALPLYDIGKLYVATMNGNDASAGYLEIDYSVRFSNPQSNVGTTAVSLVGTPTFRTRINTDQGPYYFGRTNAAKNFSKLTTSFFTSAETTVEGDTSLVTYSPFTSTGDILYLPRGCAYRMSTALPVGAFVFNYTGTYRVSWYIVGDWQDYVPFRANLLKVSLPLVGTAPFCADATSIAPTVLGTPAVLSGDDSSSRGFSVPGTHPSDMPLIGSTLVTVTNVADRYTLAIGVWNSLSIAEADNATFSVLAAGGQPSLKIEYVSTATTY